MDQGDLADSELTGSVIGAFYEVYNTLGYGFLESVHKKAMRLEIRARGHSVATEVAASVYYKGTRISTHRVDLLVNERLVLEIKSGPSLPKSAIRQLHNYLRATELEVGLLFHFGPEPKFYRQVSSNSTKRRDTPPDQQ